MAVNLSPVGGVGWQFFDNNGNPLSGGKLYTYAAGGTTPAATYTSSAGVTAHANPIVLDAGGRVPNGEIWLTDGIIYKFVLKTSTDVLIGTYDNITGINSNFVNFTAQQEIQTATADQTVFTLTTTQYQPGTNSLTVYVDGVNQYGSGAQYAYAETDSTTVTFVSGLHVGASVKFTTATQTTGNATDASVVSYTPAGTGAVTTTVQAKLRESVSVKDFGAVGDGVTDDAAAILAAITASDFVAFPEGNYLVATQITIPAANKTLIGAGGVIVRDANLNTDAVFYATTKDNLQFNGLKFSVGAGTPHTADGSFVVLDTCHFVKVLNNEFDCAIPSTVSNRESLFSAVYTPSCNDLLVQGNSFKYVYGNACGANDGAGTGVNGKNVSILGNVFFNTLDTGVGCWTNCQNVTITGNVFDRIDYTTAYNGVMIDVAGANNVTITANSFRGNVTGVRVLSNLVYTNKNILIEGNVFYDQTNGTGGELATGVKIFHTDGTGSSQNASVSVKNNQFVVKTTGYGVFVASTVTDTSKALTVQIDGNTFDLTAGNCYGVAISKLTTTGNIKFIPGSNAFESGAATGTAAVTGLFPDTRSAISEQNLTAYTTNLALNTSVENPAYFYCDQGLYALTYSLGTCTDTGGNAVMQIKSKAGISLPNTIIVNASASDTTSSSVWNIVNTSGVYKYEYTPDANTLTVNFDYLNLVKLI